MDTLGNKLGNSFFQLNNQFHHIIWMGDMNFRMSGLEIEDASAQLQAGKFEELHAANGARAAHANTVPACRAVDGQPEIHRVGPEYGSPLRLL